MRAIEWHKKLPSIEGNRSDICKAFVLKFVRYFIFSDILTVIQSFSYKQFVNNDSIKSECISLKSKKLLSRALRTFVRKF